VKKKQRVVNKLKDKKQEMKEAEKPMTEQESLALITTMINKAKETRHDTGLAAIMWGTVIAVCSLVRLSELQFNYRLPFDIYYLTFIAVMPQIYFSIKEGKERKVRAYGDDFNDYLWISFGICIFLMIFITSAMFGELQPASAAYRELAGQPFAFRLNEYISALFLLLYGLPTFVSGICMKFKPMYWGGIFCWVSSLATVYTPVKTDLLLVAVSAIFAWLLPGIIMEKDYRKAKKEIASQHV
jgi:hypothetical protein